MKTLLTLVTVLTCAALAGAAGLKLPDPVALPQTGDSPGVVTFMHDTHVDPDKPSCTGCHPKSFRILKTTPRTPITHERMTKGEQCGACHGKTAFGFEDDCAMCHR
jgi:c(7)-type cytochrome triheme protein